MIGYQVVAKIIKFFGIANVISFYNVLKKDTVEQGSEVMFPVQVSGYNLRITAGSKILTQISE